jgi:tripeptidyl-peptidase I
MTFFFYLDESLVSAGQREREKEKSILKEFSKFKLHEKKKKKKNSFLIDSCSMKLILFTCVLVAIIASVAAAGEEDTFTLIGHSVPADHRIHFEVMLHQNKQGMAELESLFWQLTDPMSELYRQWLTQEQVQAYTAPPLGAQMHVKGWLDAADMETSLHGDFIRVDSTVGRVEKLFSVKFLRIGHALIDGEIVRTVDALQMPDDVAQYVQIVHGLTMEDVPLRLRNVRDAAARSAGLNADDPTNYAVVPETIRQLYNVPAGLTIQSAKSSIGIVEFGNGAGVSFPNLAQYLQMTNSASVNITDIEGPWLWSPADPIDGEATLDVQVSTSLLPGIQKYMFLTIQGWMLEFTSWIQQRQQAGEFVPYVFSFSYGWAESHACSLESGGLLCASQGKSEEVVVRQNAEFVKIGSTGITLVGLSQDAGAASKWNMRCRKTPSVNPSSPGASPAITTLGATQVLNGSPMPQSSATGSICGEVTCLSGDLSQGATEVVCSVATGALITSGGGFGLYEKRPAYQDKSVSTYLQSGALFPPASLYNASNRAEPDVSVIGHAINIVLAGRLQAVDGMLSISSIFCVCTNFVPAKRHER